MGISVCVSGRGLLEVEGDEGVKETAGIVSAGRRQREVVVASYGSGLRSWLLWA